MGMRGRWFAGPIFVCMLLGPLPAAAEPPPRPATVDPDRFGIDVRRVGTTGAVAPKVAAGAATSRMDIDRDGRDEMVVGAWRERGGYSVIVTYSGLPQRDYITSPITSPTRPNFGDAMTSGDFNGDGYADLAIGNPGEVAPSGVAFGGAVWIFYGSATGLDLDQPQHVNQDTAGVPGVMEGYDRFGKALAAGDLNGDGRDDLAVGSDGETINGVKNAGSFYMLYGSSTGLTTTGVQMFTQDTPGVPSTVEPDDGFGRAIAVGDMTGDGYDDVAVSAPTEGEWGSPYEGGLVMLLPGGPGGVTATGVTSFLGTSFGIGALGDSLSIADIDGDRDGDLVAGAHRSWVGYIVYVPGIRTGLDVARARKISMETTGVPGDPYDHVKDGTPHTGFGDALSTGDVTGDGRADVLTGAVGYDVNGVADAGAVLLLPGSADGLTGAGSVMLTQASSSSRSFSRLRTSVSPIGPPEVEGYFGEAASILNLDGTGPLDLLTSTSHYGDDGGLLVALDPVYTVARGRTRGGWAPTRRTLVGLTPVEWWTGSDLGAYTAGYTLLHR